MSNRLKVKEKVKESKVYKNKKSVKTVLNEKKEENVEEFSIRFIFGMCT
jgi:hypothetical protein